MVSGLRQRLVARAPGSGMRKEPCCGNFRVKTAVRPRGLHGQLTASRYVLLCLLIIPRELLHTPPSMGAMNADDEYEIQDLICLSAGEPGFVRLRIRVDESGLHTRRRAYALQLFDTLDVSRDGVLDAAECRQIPSAGHLIAFHHGVSDTAVPQFGAPDTDGNGLVTPEEFSGWILAVAGPCLRIIIDAPQFSDGQPVPLFERLDQNHDGRLTPEELAGTVRRLRTLDSDLDGRIAPDEIHSPDVIDVVAPDNAAARESLAALALLEPINRYSVGDALLRKIIQKYDKLARGISARRFVKDGRLSANELGLQPDAIATSDQNGDLLLDQKELRNFLTHLQPAHELLIDFGSESTRPRIEILQQSDTSQATSLALGKLRMEMSCFVSEGINNKLFKPHSRRASPALLHGFAPDHAAHERGLPSR